MLINTYLINKLAVNFIDHNIHVGGQFKYFKEYTYEKIDILLLIQFSFIIKYFFVKKAI